MKDDALDLMVQMLREFNATTEDMIVIYLILRTDENIAEFVKWGQSLKETPSFETCLDEAIIISRKSGVWDQILDEDDGPAEWDDDEDE